MFTVVSEPMFVHPVTAMVPVDGGHEEQTFKAKFRVIGIDEAKGFDFHTAEGETLFLRRAIIELSELVDGAKNPVTYNDAVRDQVLRLPYAKLALMRSYIDGVGKAKSGN